MAVKQEEGYIEAQDGATPLNQQVSVSTPKKRKQKGDELDAGQSASKKPASPIKKLPDSAAELTDEFKMLIRMKEDSCPWSEIKQAWLRETGESASTNTLSMRYTRLKARLTVVSEEDVRKLFSHVC
ncbi:hypothetical protein KEM55_003398 [Ascosphaera atra]|nr:hypothetical protein KEM55_003398 [Ascosphaera atra]